MNRHHALSTEGRRRLRSLITQPILYGFDFDGTLARLSPDRTNVRLSRSVQEWLTELNRRATCAIVSGRSLADLRPRLNNTVPHMVGNHGLEGPHTSPSTLERAEELCRGWLHALTTQVPETTLLLPQGVDVENKRYTLTFHYRHAQDPAKVRLLLTVLLNKLTPAPRLTFGHACVNALPPTHAGKGGAALALMKRLGLKGLFYIGDDGADEEVFELSEGLAMGIRVGKVADSRAQFYVNQQEEVEEVIRFLVHRLDRTPEAAVTTEPGKTKKTA